MSRSLAQFLRLLFLAAGFSLPAFPASAATLGVPSQYATIQAAVSAASNGDTILIGDGTYTGPGNVDIDFGGKNLTVTSQHGAASTIIDCGGSATANHRGFYLHSGETGAVISGLTIQNGYEGGGSEGGGIYVITSGVAIQSCILKNNMSSAGGGIYEGNYDSTFAVTNCVFVGNKAITNGLQLGYGGGLYNYTSVGTVNVTNCTFAGNSATGGGGGMNDAGGSGSTISVTNDLFYGDSGGELLGSGSGDTVSFCDVQGGYTGSGNFIGNINADPKFANTPTDLHLQAGSPCFGAGTTSGAPITTIDGQTRPNPPSIGAYEALAGTAAASITLNSGQNPSLPTQYVSFSARVSGAGARPTGIVTFTVDGVAQPSAALFGTSASTSVGFVSPGSHSITAVYSGDAVYASSTSSVLTQVVAKAATTTAVTASVNPSVLGQSVTFTVALTQGAASAGYTPTGTITFTIDGAAQAPVALSGAAYTTSSLAVGMHTITAAYSGDAVLAGSASPALTQTVSPHFSPQYVSPSGNDSNLGTQAAPKLTIQAAVNATLSGDTVVMEDGTYTGPGNVDIDFGGRNITVTSQHSATNAIIDCGGSITVNHRGFYLHSGETSAVISGLTIQNGYEGGSNGNEVGSGSGIYSFVPGLTVQNCIIKNNTACYGGGVYCFVQGGGATIINCVFTGNTATYNGGGLYTTSYPAGAVSVINCTLTNNAAFGGAASAGGNSGGGIYTPGDTYPPGSSTVSLTNDIGYGDSGGEIAGTSAAATYCDIQGGYAGTGNISADPLFYNSPTDLHLQPGSPCGGAGTTAGAPATTIEEKTRPMPPSIGAYEVTPVGTSATTTVLASSLNPSAAGQSVTFTATVAAPGGRPTGAVTFSVDGTAQTHLALNSGSATYTTATLLVGSHLITAIYTGNGTFAPSKSAPLTQTVSQATATTTLSSSLNPSVYGQQVTFTATVTGNSPAGTVTFTDATSGMMLGTGTLSGGLATFSIASLSTGSHRITAIYSGNVNNTQSTAPALTQIVEKITTATTLTSSLNPSVAGQAVTFTAGVAGGAGTPTGTVTFTVDNVTQTPVPLNMGYSPSYTTSALPVGTHNVTAAYSGDMNFTPSVSPTLTQNVNMHFSPQYVSPSGNDSNLGTQAAPKLTIQAAVNATLSGDTVVMEDGTYTGPGNVDIDFGGRNITVTSQNGAATTVIDCGGSFSAFHRGFYLHSGETSAVISGLTIKNGNEYYTHGGAIYALNVGLLVQNCILTSNYANDGGGISIDNENGSAVIVNNSTFINNMTSYGAGGGIESSNQSSGTITITNCMVSNNSAPYDYGGGIANTAQGTGAITVSNCLLLGNSDYSGGGGIYNGNGYGGTITVTNCTLAGNSSKFNSGGVYNNSSFNPGTITLTNDIVYGDTGGEVGGTATVNNCDIQGGYAGAGNINADPLFVNYPVDLHLQAGSPCLGAGMASGAPALTIDGRTRPTPPNIGAYEVYVAPTAVTVTNASGTAGQTVTLSAALGNPGGSGLSGKTLSFSVDGAAAGAAVTNSSGIAALPYAIPAGTTAGGHALSASFAGDMTNSASSGIGTLTVSAAGPLSATQARFAPRVGWGSRMVGGKFQGSADGVSYTTLATITQTPPDNQLTTLTFASPVAYRFLRYLAPNGAYGNISELEFDSGTGASAAKISGSPFGTAGSWSNQGNDFTKAFDGNTNTYFDAPDPGNGDFVGIDQGSASPNQVRYFPRLGWESRMVGGQFQGSSDGINYTTLATIARPPGDAYTIVPLSVDPAAYRFLRYLAPNGAYGNISELEFDSQGKKLTGTAFGTAGSYAGSGNDFTKVFDGNTSTFFDAPSPGNGDFVGIDQGAGVTALGEVHFTPRAAWASRMVGGRFQGSSDGVTYTDLAAVASAPPDGQQTVVTLAADPKSYRFLRYLAPDGAYGNIAELGFYSGTGASAVKLTGTAFGTPGSWQNNGNDFTKAFDGSVSTYFDAPDPGNGDFAGIDQGAP